MRTVHDLLARSAERRASHPALVLGDRVLDHAELAARSESVAGWLVARGTRPGDRVVVHLRKGFEEVVALLGAARAGAVLVDANHQWTPRQLAHVLADSGASALVTEARRLRGTDPSELPENVLVVGEASPGTAPWSEALEAPAPGPVERDPDDLAALFYTSGSTGRPKGVMVTHRNLLDGARIVSGYVLNTPDDRVLSLLPFSFDYGMNQLLSMLHVGGTLVLQPVMMAAEIARTIREQECTGLPLVPPSWVQVVRYLQESGERLPSLRYATNTGGKIPQPVLEAIDEVLPGVDFYAMYGLTEAFRSTYLPPDELRAKRGSIGRAIPEVEVHVVHADGHLCAPGEVGELVHGGALVSLGYWNDPARTAQRIRPCPALSDRPGDEKVVYSGDLVRADEDGCLWFVGRGDDMIKCSGHRISPTEVEEVLHQAGAPEVIAFGVDDDELGQVVHAAVAPLTPGAPLPAVDELERACRAVLPGYMVPRRIHVWPDPFPRTPSGKLDRAAARAACTPGPENARP